MMTVPNTTPCDPHDGCMPLARVREQVAGIKATADLAHTAATKAHARMDTMQLLMIGDLVMTVLALIGIICTIMKLH